MRRIDWRGPRGLMLFSLLLVVLGLACSAAGYALAGWNGVEAAAWATGLCLVPGWLVFLLEPLYRLPQQAVFGSMLGTMIRLGVVMGGVLLALSARPELPKSVFVGCLVVLYLVSLSVETLALMQGGDSPTAASTRRPAAG